MWLRVNIGGTTGNPMAHGHHAKNEEVGEVKKARNMKLWQVIHHADHWDAAGKNLKVNKNEILQSLWPY